MLADQDAVQRYSAHARRRQIKGIPVADSPDHCADLRQFPASDGDVRLLRPLIQSLPELLQETCLWCLYRQIIDPSKWLSAGAGTGVVL